VKLQVQCTYLRRYPTAALLFMKDDFVRISKLSPKNARELCIIICLFARIGAGWRAPYPVPALRVVILMHFLLVLDRDVSSLTIRPFRGGSTQSGVCIGDLGRSQQERCRCLDEDSIHKYNCPSYRVGLSDSFRQLRMPSGVVAHMLYVLPKLTCGH
jgi:hypothetical protein